MKSISKKFQEGLFFHKKGKFKKAEKLYKSVIKTSPDHQDAIHNLGVLKLNLNKFDDALILFKTALNKNQKIEQFWISYIDTLIKKNLFKDAKKALEQAQKNGFYSEKFTLLNKQIKSIQSSTIPPTSKLNEILEYYQNQRYEEAEILANSTSQKFPNHKFAWKVLAIIFYKTNRFDKSLLAGEKALAADPKDPEIFNNLGLSLLAIGRLKEAEINFHNAIRLNPSSLSTHVNLGLTKYKQHKFQEAEEYYKKALEFNPNFAEALNKLGELYKEQRKFEDAKKAYEKAINLAPNFYEYHNNLGVLYQIFGLYEKAKSCVKNALDLNPDFADGHNNLGIILKDMSLLKEAQIHLIKAINLKPEYPEAYNNLGTVFLKSGYYNEAAENFKKAINYNPCYVGAYSNLALVMQDTFKFQEAEKNFKKALSLQPDDDQAHNNRNLCLNYSSIWSPSYVCEQHLKFEEQFGGLEVRTFLDFSNYKYSNNKLRIGYVSGDFKTHSVSYFFEPLLNHHNSDAVETYCYYNDTIIDDTTNRLMLQADHWRSIFSISDAEVVDLIKKDKIDILVDLSGHTPNNRLLVFAQKPAPIQVTWLGYPNTTGLSSIDYRFTDVIADPIGEADELHSETLFRLPNGFHCYKGSEAAVVSTELPQKNRGYITFGSFNNLSKTTPEVIKVWARILKAVPKSKLLLKSSKPNEDQDFYLRLFKNEGISEDRIEYYQRLPNKNDHLELYNSIDIGLDTFLFNGATTTCEALWMGVPVITLLGDRHVGRVGASILTNIGLTEFIAEDIEQYITIANKMAESPDYLQEIRKGLRQKMQNSPLCDGKSFARDIENTYQKIWNEYFNKI